MGRVGFFALLFFCSLLSGPLCLELRGADRVTLNEPHAPLFTGELQGQIASARKGAERFVAYTSLLESETAILFRRYDPASQQWGEVQWVSSPENSFNRSPDLWVAEDGSVHCVWVSRGPKRVYQVHYRRLVAKGGGWGEPKVFPAGTVSPRPRLGAAGRESLYLYYWSRPGKDEWGKVFFFGSRDGGEQWAELDPNLPGRKGEASSPRFVANGKGEALLAWLDQTPGVTSVVVNRLSEDGWSGPRVVSAGTGLSASRPRLKRIGGDILLAWSSQYQTPGGQQTRIWWDRSRDGGRNWQGSRLLLEVAGQVADYQLAGGADDPGMLWIETTRQRAAVMEKRFGEKEAEAEVVWNSDQPASLSWLTTESEGEQTVVAAAYRPIDQGYRDRDVRGRILILSKRNDEGRWKALFAEAEGRRTNATGPTGLFVDSSGWAEFCFTEVTEPIHHLEALDRSAKAVWSRIRIRKAEASTTEFSPESGSLRLQQ